MEENIHNNNDEISLKELLEKGKGVVPLLALTMENYCIGRIGWCDP